MSNINTAVAPRRPAIWRQLPIFITWLMIAAAVLYGPIDQLADFHHFADQRSWFGVSNAADVLSNIGFALVGGIGVCLLWRWQSLPAIGQGWGGYVIFFGALLLTAFGSAYYHLAPDNSRLVFDRLPIAVACAGLLSAVWNENRTYHRWLPVVLSLAACLSVWWWRFTDMNGLGDLRPYLVIQVLPLVLIPILKWQNGRLFREQFLFGLAIGCYVLAKVFELSDHFVYAHLEMISGHTLKHLLATIAAAIVLACLYWRIRGNAGSE